MEKKRKSGKVIIIVIFILALLSVGGYFAYQKYYVEYAQSKYVLRKTRITDLEFPDPEEYNMFEVELNKLNYKKYFKFVKIGDYWVLQSNITDDGWYYWETEKSYPFNLWHSSIGGTYRKKYDTFELPIYWDVVKEPTKLEEVSRAGIYFRLVFVHESMIRKYEVNGCGERYIELKNLESRGTKKACSLEGGDLSKIKY